MPAAWPEESAFTDIWPKIAADGSTLIPNVDLVSVKSLQLPRGVLFFDIWGKTKEQPALLDVELQLRHGLKSSASRDALDSSTIHYGLLSKQIRSSFDEPFDLRRTFKAVDDAVQALAMLNGQKTSSISQGRITLTLPKASAHGEGCTIIDHRVTELERSASRLASRTITFDRLRIMTLIGVNAVERTGTQALLATCSFFISGEQAGLLEDSTNIIARYERKLVEHIQQTKFETLEALAQHLYTKIREDMAIAWPAIVGVRLKLEKPSAVVHADAPSIEIVRAFDW